MSFFTCKTLLKTSFINSTKFLDHCDRTKTKSSAYWILIWLPWLSWSIISLLYSKNPLHLALCLRMIPCQSIPLITLSKFHKISSLVCQISLRLIKKSFWTVVTIHIMIYHYNWSRTTSYERQTNLMQYNQIGMLQGVWDLGMPFMIRYGCWAKLDSWTRHETCQLISWNELTKFIDNCKSSQAAEL